MREKSLSAQPRRLPISQRSLHKDAACCMSQNHIGKGRQVVLGYQTRLLSSCKTPLPLKFIFHYVIYMSLMIIRYIINTTKIQLVQVYCIVSEIPPLAMHTCLQVKNRRHYMKSKRLSIQPRRLPGSQCKRFQIQNLRPDAAGSGKSFLATKQPLFSTLCPSSSSSYHATINKLCSEACIYTHRRSSEQTRSSLLECIAD